MKKEELEIELKKVLEEADKLQQKSKLELATAEFLRNESEKLMETADNPNTPYNQKEEALKQMVALQKRLEHEIKIFNDDTPKMGKLEERLRYLSMLVETGQVE